MRNFWAAPFRFDGRIGRKQYWIGTLLYLLGRISADLVLVTLAALNYNPPADTITNRTIVGFVLLGSTSWPVTLSQWVSLREADEVSSDDGPGCVLDWLISSVVSLAEESRVSVVGCAVVELGKGGAICVESCSDCT